jgi:hypothetical protein
MECWPRKTTDPPAARATAPDFRPIAVLNPITTACHHDYRPR